MSWTADEVLDALRAFRAEHGEPPISSDLDTARAQRSSQGWRAERFRAGNYPSLKVVRARFGTLNAALRAAGLTPSYPSPTRSRPHLADSEFVLIAIRRWTSRYGEPPTNADWDPSRARKLGQEWREVRYRGGDWPTLGTVRRHYGSMLQAIAAAGLVPAGSGAPDATRRRQNQLSAAGGELRPLRLALQAAVQARAAADDEALSAELRAVAATALACAERAGRL